MKKINSEKLNSLISQSINQSLGEIKTSIKGSKTKSSKVTTEKKEKPQEEVKTKKVKKPLDKKEEVTKEVTKINKDNLVEKVISNREVKYIYPDDVTDTLSRKSWRQKVRAKLDRLERSMLRINDQNSKEYKAAKKEYDEYRKQVLKAS